MNPKAKARTWNLVRVVLTVAALLVVVGMIQFRDTIRIVKKNDAEGYEWLVTRDVREIRRSGDRATVVFGDGKAEEYPSKNVIVEKLGFFSLFEQTRKGLYFLMVAALIVPFVFLSLRWWLLLRGHGFDVSFGKVFFMTYAGGFFNKFLPGAVGGDLTKALLAVQGEERKAAVVGTVILDRVVGLAVMIVLGAACLTPFVGKFQDKRLPLVVYGLFGAMVVGYLVYFNPLLRKAAGARLPFERVRRELDGVFRSAREKKGLVFGAALLSLFAQSSGILVIYGLARAMGVAGVGLWAFFIFEPIIFIVTAVPISVGGWGVQELVYRETFGTFGGMDPNQAIALSVLYNISLILVSIPGGLLFALGTARKRKAGTPSANPDPGANDVGLGKHGTV